MTQTYFRVDGSMFGLAVDALACLQDELDIGLGIRVIANNVPS